jgi:transketolase
VVVATRHRKPEGGRHINYGVREFGMAAIMNGVALHGGYIPYGGTFLTFSDYSRNAIRMAALMKLRVIHVFTHDSIGLGEDGPTHQSVEHAASLRLIPNLDVWRPADTAETAVAWAVALQNKNKPTARCCCRARTCPTRPSRPGRDQPRRLCAGRAGRVGLKKKPAGRDHRHRLRGAAGPAGAGAAGRAQDRGARGLHAQHHGVRPPDAGIQGSVLPKGLPRIAVEMGVTDGWWKYGCAAVVGIDTFGESAPAPVLFKHFGFTPENVAFEGDAITRLNDMPLRGLLRSIRGWTRRPSTSISAAWGCTVRPARQLLAASFRQQGR